MRDMYFATTNSMIIFSKQAPSASALAVLTYERFQILRKINHYKHTNIPFVVLMAASGKVMSVSSKSWLKLEVQAFDQ